MGQSGFGLAEFRKHLKKKNFTVELLSFQRKWINLYQKFIVTDNNKQPMLPINKVSLFKNKMIS